MFELALCVNELDVGYLEKKLPKFRDDILALNGIFNIHKDNQNMYFLIASETEENKIKPLIIDFICNCIREDLKRRFILNNLKVKCKDDLKNETLIEALINFDRISDDAYIKNRIKLNNEFYIHSFYMFRLAELKKKWEQLLFITNQSGAFLKDDEIYLEVIKYLLDGIDLGDDATIEKIDNTYVAKIENCNMFCKIDSKTSLVNFLIKNNPKKIVAKSIDKETLYLIMQIFGERIESN